MDNPNDVVGMRTRLRELEQRVEEIETGIAALIERLERNEKAAAEYGDAETANAYKAAAQMTREQFPDMVDADSDRAPDIVEDLFELQERVEELEGENEMFRGALEQIALRKNGFIIPSASSPDSDATWKDAVRALRQYAQDALDRAEDGQ